MTNTWFLQLFGCYWLLLQKLVAAHLWASDLKTSPLVEMCIYICSWKLCVPVVVFLCLLLSCKWYWCLCTLYNSYSHYAYIYINTVVRCCCWRMCWSNLFVSALLHLCPFQNWTYIVPFMHSSWHDSIVVWTFDLCSVDCPCHSTFECDPTHMYLC